MGKFWISEVYPYDAGDGAGIRQHLQTRVGNAATVEPLQGNWELDAIEYSAFTVSNPGEHLFGIGHLLTNPSHTLSLRVVATKRSTSEFPGVTLDQAITGFGDTEDWKEAWNKYAEDKINSDKPPGLRPNP